MQRNKKISFNVLMSNNSRDLWSIFERLHNCENVKYVVSQNDVINAVPQLPDYVRAPLAT